ncbi:MAG: hypothetical protein IJS08_16000 [Victivallales bacterium]|nr:hypothetical protein [Victivallales bacterium]
MSRFLSDSSADKLLVYSLVAWAISSVVPAIGMLMQFPVIAYLTWKADIKGIPALLLLMLGRSNIRYFAVGGQVVLRLGITISPVTFFTIVAFFVVIKNVILRKYDGGSLAFIFVWALSGIPAWIMSYDAKAWGLSGYWANPILDFLIPSVYFWGLAVASSYEFGKEYFAKRLALVLIMIETLQCVRIVNVFTFSVSGLIISLGCYFMRKRQRFGNAWKFLSCAGVIISLLLLTFGRRIGLEAEGGSISVASADEYGSTFSRMGVYALVIIFLFWFRHHFFLNRYLPILMVVANLAFVNYAVNTQTNEGTRRDVTFQYETLKERINAKLFGDRASVWAMGWEEMRTPPYFIKDLRAFLSFDEKTGYRFRVLPHNQFLTLLGRHGWWLGLTLAIFIIWIWIRAMKAVYYCMDDPFLYTVFVPTGLAVYAVVGTTGQSVVSSALWSNSLACIIMPAIVYGVWRGQRKIGVVK